MALTTTDPVCGADETVRLETDAGSETFRAVVSTDGGVVTVSPVPERVSPGRTVGAAVKIASESAPDGWYVWGDHRITDVGTKVVRLTPLPTDR